MSRVPSTWTSSPHSTGRRVHLTDFTDGMTAVGLLGEGDRMAREILGPLAADECATLARALVERALAPRPNFIEVKGAASRLDALARATCALLALERNLLRAVTDGVERDEANDALARVREVLADLAAVPS